MSFESPDSLQISTRLGKPSAEQVPEIIPTPETPPAPAAALPEQDEFKISTRLQPDAHRELPVELAEPASITKPEEIIQKQETSETSTQLPPETAALASTESVPRPETVPSEPTEPYIDPYGEWVDFRGHQIMGNGETEHEEFQIGQKLTAKPELLKLLPELAPVKTFKIVGFTDDHFVIVQIDGGKVWGYAATLVRGYFETTSPAQNSPAIDRQASETTIKSEVSPELIARAKEIIAKLDTPGNMPAQLTKSTEEILRAYGFSQDDINSRTPQDLLEELRGRVKSSPNQAETITESEWQTIDGDTVKADPRLERNGMHVGDYLKLSNARQGLFGPIIESATTLQIVGFTDEASDDRVIVQIDHDRVRLIYGWDINKYFELTSSPETTKEESKPATEPQSEEQTPESKATLDSATEAETSAEQEPLTQYLDIGDKVKIINEAGQTEEDWTIEDIYTMSLASKDIERAVIINTQGTRRTVEMSKLETWNPAPEQPAEPEAEPDRSFHEGEEVLILSEETGELESGWHITYVSETVLSQKIFGFADVENAEGVTKRIALSTLRAWNTEKKPTTTETTASVEISVELTNKNKPEHYSAEWIAQTLKQFNIDPEKLEGFAALTDGQKALVVENFQSMMMETITERAHKGLKTGNAFQRISKSWLKGIFVAKGKKEALTELEVGDEALKVQALRQLIDGMELLQPEIIVENGRMKKQYITPVNLGIDGPITPLQDVAMQRFNQAANDLARLPVEWQKTGTTKEKKQFTEQTALFQKYSENLLREISKTQDAPAVELAILRAHFGIQMDQTLTAHPQVEKALLNIKSPKLWVEGLKSTLTERGLYAVGGSLTRLATVHALGAIGAPIAALAVGAWRAHDRSQDTLKERDRLARKGVADTSNERATMQPVVMDVDTRKANLSAEQKSLDQKIRKEQDNLAKTSDEKETAKIKAHIASMEERLAYLNNSITTTDESDLAGVSGGLTVKLEEMMMRIDLETDVSKRANLQMRLKRRIDYTAYQLERGLVNFGPAEERVVNHYRLMNAMGEALAGTWLDKTTLPQPELAKLSKYQLKVQNQIETFLRNQLSGTDKRRRSYITKEMIKGGLWGAGFALGGYLITKFAQEARVDHDLLSDNHHGTTGTDPEHLRQTAGTDGTAVTSPFQTASQTNIVEDGQTHLPTSLPTEHYTAAVERGSNVWKTTEHLLSEKFKDRFSNLNDAQKTYLIDSIKDKIQAHPEQFGLHAGQSIDQIQAGQVINFDAVMKDHSITSLLFDHAKSLNPEQMASIVHNNEILHHWIINNPSEALTADNVDSILQGTHYLGITPQALDQAIADGGSKILSIDQGLSPASTTAIINQILYGHPHGQEALMAQVKEALHDTHYLEAIDKAQHYDSGHMTAGWLQTLRGREWLDHHDGDVWNQDGAVYTVVKDVPAKTAKSLLARAYEAAKDQLESVGIPDEREPELVSFASNLAGKTVDAIYRVE